MLGDYEPVSYATAGTKIQEQVDAVMAVLRDRVKVSFEEELKDDLANELNKVDDKHYWDDYETPNY